MTKAFEEVRQREAEAAGDRDARLTGQEYDAPAGRSSPGKITFWVLPDDSGVTITAPGAGGGSRQAPAAPTYHDRRRPRAAPMGDEDAT